MRILVAGAGGFIGYHLVERLLREGCEVVGVDNYVSGQPRNTADLQAAFPGYRFVEHDVCDPPPDLGPLDQIYDLACPASPADFDGKRLEILAVCSRGVWNLLDLARKTGARLLHASTSEVYGDPLEHPQKETYWGNVNPIGPRACYDEGKRFAEALLTSYAGLHGVAVRIVRIFNTYGPRMRPADGRALPNFIGQALRSEPLTLHGDGSQTRSFCYVTDQVDGLMRLMNSEVADPVNIGNPVEITMRQLAEEVVELTGSDSPIICVPRPADDPNVRRPDITRATQLLGWAPQVERRAGLQQTINWFRTVAAG